MTNSNLSGLLNVFSQTELFYETFEKFAHGFTIFYQDAMHRYLDSPFIAAFYKVCSLLDTKNVPIPLLYAAAYSIGTGHLLRGFSENKTYLGHRSLSF